MKQRPVLTIALVVAVVAVLAGAGVVAMSQAGARPTTPPIAGASVDPSPTGAATATASPSPTPIPTPTPVPTPTPSPTPIPTPTPVPDPLTGRLVTPDVAQRRPIAVMIDDQADARPQSGFNAASIVWQAPAEGGIPRYMLIFQDRIPEAVGPVRSARYYYIGWAAEWNAVYAHVGGSPQAMQTLRDQGNGQLVYNADEFRWGGTFFHRITQRRAPHNVYTDGRLLWRMADRLGADDLELKAAWKFAPDAPLEERPSGGTISAVYQANRITYRYDRKTNTYLRSVTGETKQVDAATGERVAPKNVVIMRVRFGPLNDSNPAKNRLEADFIGTGKAWIATNGKTILGTWKKTSLTAPTRFYDAKGNQVRLTVGQTFIQVMKLTDTVTIKDGKVPSPDASASPSASTAP